MLNTHPITPLLAKHKIFTILFFLSLLFSFSISQAESIKNNFPDNHRIIGGTSVTQDTYPWMVALLTTFLKDQPFNAFSCGGSLIHPEWVLTAAHCVSDFETGQAIDGETSVWFNGVDLQGTQGTVIDVEKVHVHPFWISREYDGDIALLKLKSPANVSTVDITGMSYDQYNYPAGTSTTVMGWGGTEVDGGEASPKLLEVEVPLVDQDICTETMLPFGPFDEKMLCAGLKEGGKDSCFGDSGGPLIVNNGGNIEQIGIVSAGGNLCAQPNEYGTYTRVERYADWISETMCSDNNIVNTIPDYNLTVTGSQVSLTVTSSGSDKYRLYYAPSPSMQPIAYIDLNEAKTYTTKLDSGSQYFVAVQAYDGPCTSQLSSIKSFSIQ